MMSPKRIAGLILAVSIALFPGIGWSAGAGEAGDVFDLLDAPLTYSADFYFVTKKWTVKGKVYHAPGKERREYRWRDEDQILLLRRDLMQAYWLLPSRRMYVSLALDNLGEAGDGLNALVLNRTFEGGEKLDGVDVRRFRITGESPAGTRFAGTIWQNPEGVVVKATGTDTFFVKQGTPVEIGLGNITYGNQDDSLFDLPVGYVGVSLKNASDIAELNRLLSSFSRQKLGK